MHRVAQRIKDGSVFLRNRRIQFPEVGFRNHHILGERAIRVNPNDFHALADVGFAGSALHALAAGHMHFSGNEVALLHAGDFVTVGSNFAAELVSGNQRRMNAPLRPSVPLINVQIRAADGCNFNFDQNFVAAECRDFDFANLSPGSGMRFHYSLHGLLHPERSRKTTDSSKERWDKFPGVENPDFKVSEFQGFETDWPGRAAAREILETLKP